MSQEDLFRRCKEEETDDIHILAGDPDPKRRLQDDSGTPQANHSGKRLLDRVNGAVETFEAKVNFVKLFHSLLTSESCRTR